MRFTVLFNLLLIGLSQAQLNSSVETTLDKVYTVFNQYVMILENIITESCKSNKQQEAAEKLQLTFLKTDSCLFDNKILATSREEHLAAIDECSRELINQSKSCLSESRRYFPDLLLSFHKSIANFLYDDYDIINVNMANCFPKLQNDKVANDYQQCVKQAAVHNNDSTRIPDTREKLCQTILPTSHCFTNVIEENCDRTPAIAKFRKDYIKTYHNICERNKSIQSAIVNPYLIVILTYHIILLF